MKPRASSPCLRAFAPILTLVSTLMLSLLAPLPGLAQNGGPDGAGPAKPAGD